MSVTDILKKIGKATETSKLAKEIAKELEISDRHAYRLIKKAWKNKEIKRARLPDRSCINFLPEWGALLGVNSEKNKETLGFKEAFLYRCFRKLEEISDQCVYYDACKAFDSVNMFIARLPKELKDKIKPKQKRIMEIVAESEQKWLEKREKSGSDKELEKAYSNLHSMCAEAVEVLIDEVSTSLHDYQL